MQCINCKHIDLWSSKEKGDYTCWCKVSGKITLSFSSADECENFEEGELL